MIMALLLTLMTAFSLLNHSMFSPCRDPLALLPLTCMYPILGVLMMDATLSVAVLSAAM